jgi:tight adherence protein C
MSFQAALTRVADDDELIRPGLRRELQLTLQEMAAGCPRDEAMKHLARRCADVNEISGLVSHIIQAERLGGSIGKTLQVCANSLRFNRFQDMKEWVQKMPVKLAFPLIFCILPCLLIVIGGPALIRLFEVLGRH